MCFEGSRYDTSILGGIYQYTGRHLDAVIERSTYLCTGAPGVCYRAVPVYWEV